MKCITIEFVKVRDYIQMENKKCIKCYGYGFWPIGDLIPIGELDSQEFGKRVIKCPWCKAGFIDKGDRYKALNDLNKKKTKAKGSKNG